MRPVLHNAKIVSYKPHIDRCFYASYGDSVSMGPKVSKSE